MALENFVEMRDHVADPKFLLKKEVGLALERKYPARFIPRYSMVSFHRIPYAIAMERGRIQTRILDGLCGPIQSVDELDWGRAEELIHTMLKEH